MLEVRSLAPTTRRPARPGIPRGLEAIWTATAIGLRGHAEDLVSEPGVGPALDIILGAKLKSLLKQPTPDPRRLLISEALPDRRRLALGAAMALKAQGQKGILLTYAYASELNAATWTRILTAAQAAELPMIFVILPEPTPKVDIFKVAAQSKLPAIAVEANDPIAIYRVAQESIVRARAGGGAALIAGVQLSPKPQDPIELLASQLLARKACTPLWLTNVQTKVSAFG